MSKIKSILLTGLSMVLVAALSIAGTVAYLQDEDSAVNVMTLGNVKIEQNEYQRATNADGSYKTDSTGYVLEPFTQAKPLYPATELDANGNPFNHGAGDWDTTQVDMSQVGSQGLQKVFTSKNAQDKIVTVKNTGKSDAYVRTWIALEDPFTEGRIGINVGNTDYYEQTSWTTVEIDGVKYSVSCFTYKEALKPGEVSTPSLFQVYLNYKATNEDMELLGDTYEILAFSQAVQTAGFDSADAALDAAFGDNITANHPWSNTVIVDTNNESELLDAITSGKDIVLNTDIVEIDDAAFNGNGTEITLAGSGSVASQKNYGYLAFAPGKGNDTKVENVSVTGSGFVEVGHYGEGGGTYEVNNLVIKDMTATLCINNGGENIAAAFAQYGTATLNNCVMTGTVALKAGYTPYDASFVNGTKTTINGGEYGSIYMANQAAITIKDAKVGLIHGNGAGIVSRNTGAKLEIQAGAEIDKIELSAYNNTYTLNDSIIIRAGAEIDTLVLNMRNCTKKTILNIEDGAVINHLIIDGVEVDYNTWKNS